MIKLEKMSVGDEELTPEIRFDGNMRAEISWKPPQAILGYIIERRIEGGDWVEVGRVAGDRYNLLTGDFLPGMKYECRVIVVYGNGSRGLGASKKFQVPSAPKILSPTVRQIPLRATFPTRLDVHYSGYPDPIKAWTDVNDQPLSIEFIPLAATDGDQRFISCLIIPPITDGIQLKYVKFKVENSQGKDEAIFELITDQGKEAANPIPISTAENEQSSKKVQNLQATKLMSPFREYVQLTWTAPKVPWSSFIVQRRETTTMKWNRISEGKLLTMKFLDGYVTVGGNYQYRVLTVIPGGEIVGSDATETVSILMKEKMDNGIELGSSGQEADSAGPSVVQNTEVNSTVRAEKRPAKKSGRAAKIIKRK